MPSLAGLLDAGISVPLVVTQPDRAVGRHAEPRPTPVAAFASASGLDTLKPDRLRGDAALLRRLEAARPDALAVVAFGRILPGEILALPRLAPVNVHASLLPRYRGASPIQAALLNGDAETGVVTMRIVEELDAGPVYLSRTVPIGARETAGELSDRLAAAGAGLLVETLRGIEAGTLAPQPQRGEASYCRPIRREDGAVDWSRDALAIARRLRAFTPWPGLYTFLGTERIKILRAEETDAAAPGGPPGTFRLEDGRLVVSAGASTALEISSVQRAGRRPVSGAEFARSSPLPGRFETAPK